MQRDYSQGGQYFTWEISGGSIYRPCSYCRWGKSYDHLIKLKSEYGSNLDCVLPYPGDWHTIFVFWKMFYLFLSKYILLQDWRSWPQNTTDEPLWML
jgi:hypothetical protein